jgi:hypothetical protein
MVAIPLSFVVTALPAYWFGLVTKTDLLDVFIANGTGRYIRLGMFAFVWAFVMTVLVSLLVAPVRRRTSRPNASERA